MAAQTERSKPKGLKIWCFRLVAMFGIPLAFFGAVEIGLRVFDYGYDPSFLVRDEEDRSKLRANEEFGFRFFPAALARTPQPMRITEEKPSGVRRILLVGGSAAMGDPEPAYGPARILELLLEEKFPGEQFEVINAAVTAINSHVVLPIVRDCMKVGPDVVIVYMGNNEVHGPFGRGSVFGSQAPDRWVVQSDLALRKLKLGQLLGRLGKKDTVPDSWGGLEMFLDQQVRRDDPGLENVYANFRANLSGLIDTATSEGAKVILSTVGSNLRDFSPFVSFPSEVNPQCRKLIETGSRAQLENHFETALTTYREAEEQIPDHAELQYRIATCLLETGDFTGAANRFKQARDLDGLRFRADSRINTIIAEVAAESGKGAFFVDAEEVFATASESGVPGDEFFWEHVHLNFEGSHLLARHIADKVVEALSLSEPASATWTGSEECKRKLGLTSFHEREILNFMVRRVSDAPFSGRAGNAERRSRFRLLADELKKTTLPGDLEGFVKTYENLIAADKEDWMLRKEFASLLTAVGRDEAAITHRKTVVDLLPHHPDAHLQLGSLLNHAKKWNDAIAPLRKAIELRPFFSSAHNSLGVALSRTGSLKEAQSRFERALEIRPMYAEASINLALVLLQEGKRQEAITRLSKAAKYSPDHPKLHYHLGQQFVKQKDFANAAKHYGEVVRLLPNDAAAHLNLALVFQRLDRRQEAAEQFERVLRLEPSNELARTKLEELGRNSAE